MILLLSINTQIKNNKNTVQNFEDKFSVLCELLEKIKEIDIKSDKMLPLKQKFMKLSQELNVSNQELYVDNIVNNNTFIPNMKLAIYQIFSIFPEIISYIINKIYNTNHFWKTEIERLIISLESTKKLYSILENAFADKQLFLVDKEFIMTLNSKQILEYYSLQFDCLLDYTSYIGSQSCIEKQANSITQIINTIDKLLSKYSLFSNIIKRLILNHINAMFGINHIKVPFDINDMFILEKILIRSQKCFEEILFIKSYSSQHCKCLKFIANTLTQLCNICSLNCEANNEFAGSDISNFLFYMKLMADTMQINKPVSNKDDLFDFLLSINKETTTLYLELTYESIHYDMKVNKKIFGQVSIENIQMIEILQNYLNLFNNLQKNIKILSTNLLI